MKLIRDSVTRLPRGFVTVPLIDYGTSVEAAKRLLVRSGLVGRSPAVNIPHYATGTEPSAGNVVKRGTSVDLTIGGG